MDKTFISDEERKVMERIDDMFYEKVTTTWKAAKPSLEAQSIRSSMDFQDYVNDWMPSYVWNIADIAAQRAFDYAGFVTTPAKKGNKVLTKSATANTEMRPAEEWTKYLCLTLEVNKTVKEEIVNYIRQIQQDAIRSVTKKE